MNFICRKLILINLLCFFLLGTPCYAFEEGQLSNATLKEIWFKDDEFVEEAALETEIQNESVDRGTDLENLIRAKYKLISGDLKLSKFYLNRIDDKKSRVIRIKQRYLAIISFIEGKFAQSLDYLKDKNFYESSIFPQVCLLKLINFMATNDIDSLKREKDSCMSYSIKTSKN